MHRRPLRITACHPSLAGHFPGQPVVPGVVILDEIAAFAVTLEGVSGRVARIPQVKFIAPLLPEQQATIELEVDATGTRIRFRVERGDDLIASGELAMSPA